MPDKIYLEVPEFTGGNVPIPVAAKVLNKDQQYVRLGLIQGVLPIGAAFKKPGSSQYDYYISPKLFWEFTGYKYNPNEESA